MSATNLVGVSDKAGWLRASSAAKRLRDRGQRLVLPMIEGFQLVAGFIVAWFWVRSASAHITNSHYFLSSIYSYEIVGPRLGITVAVVLPALQMVLAAALVTRRLVGGALFVSVLMLGVFAAAQLSAISRGLDIGCGCFGPAERQQIGGESVATTSLLFACAGAAFVLWVFAQRARRAVIAGTLRRGMSWGAPPDESLASSHNLPDICSVRGGNYA